MKKWLNRRNLRLGISLIKPHSSGIVINIVSWNHGGAHSDCDDLIEIGSSSKPHLLLIASVECGGILPNVTGHTNFATMWLSRLREQLIRRFKLVTFRRRQGIVISIWVSVEVDFPKDRDLMQSSHMDLTWDFSGRKGSVAVSFRFMAIVFTFIVAHLDATQLGRRMKQLRKVIDDASSRCKSDILVIVGDMNFRIDLHRSDILRAARLGAVDPLLAADQLTKLLKTRPHWLYGWSEPEQPPFLPTYKLKRNRRTYDFESGRVPAFTDRVLIRSNMARSVHCLEYTRGNETYGSDHYPILARILIGDS